MRWSPYCSLSPPTMRRSTAAVRRTSLPSRAESCSRMRSRSSDESSTAVVTVARTRPAASSARFSYSSTMPAISSTRPVSMSILERLVASGSRNFGAAINSSRRAAEIVGFVKTCSTVGSLMRSLSAASCRCHSATRPSSEASSNTASAYRLAAAVATRNLLDGPVDQLLVFGQVERLADDLFCGRDDQSRHLAPNRLDRLQPLGIDLLERGLADPPGLVLCFLLELLSDLFGGLGSGVDHGLRRAARLVQLRLRFLQSSFGGDPCFFSFFQLVGHLALTCLGQPDDLWIHVTSEDRHHDQECDQLDDHRPIDVDDAGNARQKNHLLDLAQEDESECEVDEVHGLDEPDDREQPGDHPALRFWLSGHAADECVAGQAVTERGAHRTESHQKAEPDKGSSKLESVVCHLTLLSGVVLETLAGGTEINDRQQHEDECLDEADEDYVERFPKGEQRGPEHCSSDGADSRQRQSAEACDEADHHRAGKDVAEEPKGQGDRFDQLFENVEGCVNRTSPDRELEGFREAPQVAPPTECSHAVPLHNPDHDQRHCQRLVQIGVGAMQDWEESKRQDLEPVGDEDVHEQRHRQRDDEERVIGDIGLDQGAQLVVAQFEDGLDFRRLALSELRAKPEADSDGHHNGESARYDAVVVQGAKRAAPEVDSRVGTRGRVRVDHARRPFLTPAATMISCAAATPMSTAHIAIPTSNATRIAIALTAAIRMRLDATKGVPISRVPATRRPLKEPMTKPAPRPRPSDRCPATPARSTMTVARAADATTVSRTTPPTFTE